MARLGPVGGVKARGRDLRWTVTAAAVVLCTMAAGCGAGSNDRSPGQQLMSWAQNTDLTTRLTALRGDLADAATYADAAVTKEHTVCDVLVTDALNANQQLPTPDATLTSLLGRAYAAAGTAGHDCFSGAGGNAALLAGAASQIQDALHLLVQAEARYDSVVQSLPGAP